MKPHLEAVYERVVAYGRTCGDIEVKRSGATTELRAPQLFATIEVGSRAVDLHLLLPGRRRVPGIVKFLGGDDGNTRRHTLRLRRVDDVTDEVRTWLCEAYAGAVMPDA